MNKQSVSITKFKTNQLKKWQIYEVRTITCELCVNSMVNFMILLFWLQIAVSTWKGSSRMADCTSLLTPLSPSLYEQYCCIPSNSRKKLKTSETNALRFIFCPNHLPSSCQRFTLNCLKFFKQNVSPKSGYYTILSPNGSLISIYCDMEGSNCDGKGGWMRVG